MRKWNPVIGVIFGAILMAGFVFFGCSDSKEGVTTPEGGLPSVDHPHYVNGFCYEDGTTDKLAGVEVEIWYWDPKSNPPTYGKIGEAVSGDGVFNPLGWYCTGDLGVGSAYVDVWAYKDGYEVYYYHLLIWNDEYTWHDIYMVPE